MVRRKLGLRLQQGWRKGMWLNNSLNCEKQGKAADCVWMSDSWDMYNEISFPLKSFCGVSWFLCFHVAGFKKCNNCELMGICIYAKVCLHMILLQIKWATEVKLCVLTVRTRFQCEHINYYSICQLLWSLFCNSKILLCKTSICTQLKHVDQFCNIIIKCLSLSALFINGKTPH